MALINSNRIRVLSHVIVILYIAFYAFTVLNGTGLQDRNGKLIGTDFLCYYAVSDNLINGIYADNYDLGKIHQREIQIVSNPDQVLLAWRYPPLFFLFIYPLAIVPYLASLFFWLAITLAGYVHVIRKIAPRIFTATLVLAFPATLVNIANGQNGFLSALLIGQGLLLLDKNPRLAGIVLSLLLYKPHLGFLLFIALAAGRKWSALFSACISASVLGILTLALFGNESWEAFFRSVPVATDTIERGILPWEKLLTVFAGARLVGLDIGNAYIVQAIATGISVIAVVWSWWKQVGPLAYIVLICSIFLATPFGFQYDLAIMGLAIAWYVSVGKTKGWLPGERLVLFAAWAMPLFYIQVAEQTHIPVVPFVLLSLLLLVLRRQIAGVQDSKA